MRKIRIAFAAFIFLSFGASLFAQTPAKPAFEVASIKPLPSLQAIVADIQSGKLRPNMLGLRVDGVRVDIGATTLNGLIMTAYKIKQHQIAGPEWLRSQLFEVHATLPEGASKDQVPEMLQSLLEERFKLAIHHENREEPIYALTVAKGGPKLKAAAEASDTKKESSGKEVASIDTPEGQVKMKQDGNSITVSGAGADRRMTIGPNGAILMEISKVKMSELAAMLTQFVDRPVLDKTELAGSYQVTLEIPREDIVNMARKILPELGIDIDAGGGVPGSAPSSGLAGMTASDPSGRGIFQSVQQLGLKLDSQKLPIDTIVIDHVEKTPSEN